MSNELLIVLLGIAAVLLAVAPEVVGQGGRVVRLIAGILGLVVITAALVR